MGKGKHTAPFPKIFVLPIMDIQSLPEPININLPDADLVYYPHFFSTEVSQNLMQALISHITWKHEKITIFGKKVLQPRLTAYYGNPGKPYAYSHISLDPNPWTNDLLFIKNSIEDISGHRFTSVLLNYYRDGHDSMGWHSDDEKELGINPVIGSVSFGASRKFMFKHKKDKTLKSSIMLENGSLLLMQGATQHHWQHQIPKTKKPLGARINLTFRKII